MTGAFKIALDAESAGHFTARAEILKRDLDIATARLQRAGNIHAHEARCILRLIEELRQVLQAGLDSLGE